jgi:hypothetical protein
METPNPPNQKVRTSVLDDTKVLPTVFASSVLPPCGQSRPDFDMFARCLSLMCRGQIRSLLAAAQRLIDALPATCPVGGTNNKRI